MKREPTDYAANRGPLDRVEYVRRRPDGFSVFGGILGCLIALVFAAASAILVLTVLVAVVRRLLGA